MKKAKRTPKKKTSKKASKKTTARKTSARKKVASKRRGAGKKASSTKTKGSSPRRNFTDAFRRSIGKALAEGASPSAVTKKHKLSSSLIYRWKQQYIDSIGATPPRPAPTPTPSAKSSVSPAKMHLARALVEIDKEIAAMQAKRDAVKSAHDAL